MFKLIIASSLLVAVRGANYPINANVRVARQPSYLAGGYGGGGGGDFSGGYGGGQGGFDSGYDNGYSLGSGSSHGFQGQLGGHGFSQGGSLGGIGGIGGGLHGLGGSGGQGLGHDHHGGVSIVGVGGDQKGITFDLTKNSGSGHEGTFGGSIVSSHQSGGKSQSYSDGGASASAPWAKGAEQFQGGSFSSNSYGGVPFGGQGYEYQQQDYMH